MLAETQDRIRKAVKGILKRHKGESPLLVLRPVVLGLLRCLLETLQMETLWQNMESHFTWRSYELDEASL